MRMRGIGTYMQTYKIEQYYVQQAYTEKEQRQRQKGKAITNERTLSLYVVRLVPEQPLCLVQFIHGIDDHVDRYIQFAEHLASHGIAVVMHDLRGHGGSCLNERVTYMGEEPLQYLHNDIDIVYASYFREAPDCATMEIGEQDIPSIDPMPRYLLGFSMGALIAGNYAGQYDERLAGLLLAGLPHRELMLPLALALGWIRFLSLFYGEAGRPFLLGTYSLLRYNIPFWRAGESGAYLWLSEDKENRERYLYDISCAKMLTISAYRFLLTLLRDMYRPASWEMTRRDLPIWLFSGEKDPIAGGEKWALDGETFLSDIGYTHIDDRIFPGARHEIFLDTNRQSVWQEVVVAILDTVETEQARLDALREKEEAEYTSLFEKS